jgi:1-acyl-sn-glycerol-3-phosphate acyltransferase
VNILYEIGKGLFYVYFKLFNRLEIRGLENFPEDKSVLLCSNHISNLDPPLVGSAAPRMVHFMAKEELFKNPIAKGILNGVGAFPIKRGMSDKQAIRKAMALLKDNKVVGLFPEGTRSKTRELGKGLTGAGFFALRSNSHIVPCAVTGSYKPFHKVIVTFGRPIDFSSLREEKASAKEATEKIMEEIGYLLVGDK